MIKSTGIVRKMDELGRVVLPVEIRQLIGLKEDDSLEILVDSENRRILLEKAKNTCLRCQTTEDLREIKPGFYLCRSCLDQLK